MNNNQITSSVNNNQPLHVLTNNMKRLVFELQFTFPSTDNSLFIFFGTHNAVYSHCIKNMNILLIPYFRYYNSWYRPRDNCISDTQSRNRSDNLNMMPQLDNFRLLYIP